MLDRREGDKRVAQPDEVSVVWLSQLDACVTTVVHCLVEIETRSGHRKKTYADTYEAMEWLAMERFIGYNRAFVSYWVQDELNCTTSDQATKQLKVPCITVPSLAVSFTVIWGILVASAVLKHEQNP